VLALELIVIDDTNVRMVDRRCDPSFPPDGAVVKAASAIEEQLPSIAPVGCSGQ